MPAKVTPEEFVEALEQWSVLDVVNAVKAIEEKFGIKAAAPVAIGGQAPTQTNGEAQVEEEEKTEFTVVLSGVGASKINVIKAVRELTNLGLKEAKDLVDSAPKPVLENVSKEDADAGAAKLQEAGATTELQ
ncbi:MAG: 50S ribosomal protein L7/L12 [bacterium]|jgi:large subunit ribosomal protein L7/L12|nr:50S ribosomal protein L7/L12 [bacterium]